jgi:tetratricopeptide (TPR) repeat protein
MVLGGRAVAQPPATGPAPSAPAKAEALLAQAVELHQAGDILGAIAAYEAALELQPDNAGAHSNLGAALVRLGRYEDGLTHYRRALALDPSNASFRFNLALALYKVGDTPAAAAELEAVLAAQRGQKNARLLLGDCYLRMGRYQDVVDLLAPWEEEFGDDRAFGYVLGTAFVETDRPDHAQRVMDRIFRAGDSAEAHLVMATAHMRASKTPEALAELRKAAEMNPQLPLVHALMGRAYLRSGDQESAMKAFRRELEINPNDFQSNLELGELKKREQLFDDALVYIHRARRMRPNDATAGFALAGVYVSTGKADDARQILEQVVKAEPKYTEAFVLLATVYYRLQRKEDGDRMRTIVEQLNAEAQARQQGGRPKG